MQVCSLPLTKAPCPGGRLALGGPRLVAGMGATDVREELLWAGASAQGLGHRLAAAPSPGPSQ